MAGTRVDELRKRLAKDPASRLFAQLAEELRKEGALVEALALSREGLSRHPSYTSARLTLGRCLLESGDARGAVTELQRVAAEAPDNILGLRLLAESQERAGDLRAAADSYRAAQRLAPDDPQITAKLAAAERQAPARVPAAPAPVPHVDPFAPLPLAELGPLETFELETAGGMLVGGPAPSSPPDIPVSPSLPALALGSSLESESADSATIRVRRVVVPERSANEDAAAPLASLTLAELYRSQGALEKAIDTSVALLRREPGNVKALALQNELREQQRLVVPLSDNARRRATIERTIQGLEGLLASVKRA